MSSEVSTNDHDKRTILTERRGSTLLVTINRPEVRHALDEPTASALAQALREFDRDETLAVAVLNGSGGTFCSGFDLKTVAKGTQMPQVSEEGDGPVGVTRMLLSKPVIAAIEGYAVAGGLEVAIWCDLRVAAENAIFGIFNRRWGVPLDDGGTIRLPHKHEVKKRRSYPNAQS